MHKYICGIRKKLKNKHFPVRQRPFLRKINLENGGGCGIMKYRKEGPVYGRIPYELEFLMLLQAAKKFANVRFNSVVHDNRCPDRDILINRLCIRIRRIDTAVRTVREVDCAAKICSCLHVMDSDVSVERHPEIHR